MNQMFYLISSVSLSSLKNNFLKFLVLVNLDVYSIDVG